MTYIMYMNTFNNKMDDSILKTFEMYLGFNLPRSYRGFLLDCNGGSTNKRIFKLKNDEDSALRKLFGFVPDKYHNILLYYRNYKNRIPENMFPIGNDPFGNLILLSVKNADRGKIYFWDHEMEADEGEIPDYSNLTLIANSFEEFIASLRDEEDL